MSLAVDWTGGRGGRTAFTLFIPRPLLPLLAGGGLLFAAALYPFYRDDSLWVGVVLAVTVIVSAQACFASARIPWIPGLIIVTAAMQWVFAPWAAYHVPAPFPVYSMSLEARDYFAYAVPVTLCLAGGLFLSVALARLGKGRSDSVEESRIPSWQQLQRTCDAMIAIGLVVAILIVPRLTNRYQYAGVLVGDLACVAALALLIMDAPRWWIRMAIVIAGQIVIASVDGVFHDLFLWISYVSLVFAYRRRLRPWTIVGIVSVAGYLMSVVNGIKWDYRRELTEAPDTSAGKRLGMLATAVSAPVLHPTDVFSQDHVTWGVMRLNQGWIIARIIRRVPTVEPYARGETIVGALQSAAIPRLLNKDKYFAGGGEYFQRFTGLALGGASMNLGLSGEMYANYGPLGGCLAVFVWGILVGLIFVQFARAARSSPLWWAWAPYVMLYTAQAEDGVGEAVNQVVKSALVMLVVILCVPAWRRLRSWEMPKVLRRFSVPQQV